MSLLESFLSPLDLDSFRDEYLAWRPLYRPPTPGRRARLATWASNPDATRDDVADALAVPAENVRATLVSETPGTVRCVPADPVDTITVVLAGAQHWRVAPGAHDPAERGMPVESYRLDAGAAIYVPRDWWHETTSEGPCLALRIQHTPAAATLDTVLAAVRAHLERDCRWPSRALALWDADRRARLDKTLALAS